ncbi:(2Fe-2S) ferredoxin domain-containing protein [Alloiococcus sp. CFN-8]|uniref:(2Fe-2S) ferredoxin domain-containing protein n=1 Tax=Alloiococcus sp. CFN-8 TaxID=3416081 RepID=UPI003CE6F620
MKITVCIGSSCHLKGSRQVVEELQQLISENNLEEEVHLSGVFCMGRCQEGVSVSLDGEKFSLTSKNVKDFFQKEVISRV